MKFPALAVTSVSLLFILGVDAGSYPVNVVKRTQEAPRPSCSNFTPFAYAGCFTDFSSPRALLFSGPSTSKMTVETCVAFCKGNNYKYAGLEYYNECFCGVSVNGPQVNESSCSFPCAGDNTETCGGNDYINIYQDTTFPTVDNTVISDYMPMGCYSEGSNGRSLAWKQNQLNATKMTVGSCLFACKGGGYSFAGVEFGKECYCGVVMGNGTLPLSSASCNIPCTGNSSETCGGRSTLNMYVAKDLESTQPCNGGGLSSSSSIIVTSTTTSLASFSVQVVVTTSSSTSQASLFSSTATHSSSSSAHSSSSSSSGKATSSQPVVASSSSLSSIIATTPLSQPPPSTSNSLSSTSLSSSSQFSSSSSSSSASSSQSSSTQVIKSSLPYTSSSTSSPQPAKSSSSSSTPFSTLLSSTRPSATSTSRSTSSPAPSKSSTLYTSTKSLTSSPISPVITSSTKTSASLCTSTIVTSPTPTCEYECGNWCSKPLPTFSDSQSCWTASTSCAVQVAACFLQAGFPDSSKCLDFSEWCSSVSTYCTLYCPGPSCHIGGCKSRYPPSGPATPPPTTSILVYTCPAASPAKPSTISTPKPPTTTTVPIPTNSNICKQPSSQLGGYDVNNPVGGIPLPCLTCNNHVSDYNAGNCFKLYTSPDTQNCPSYSCSGSNGPAQGCRDACDSQFTSCLNTFAEGCRAKRSGGDTYNSASQKCTSQWQDCYAVNSAVSVSSGRCGSFNSGWS